MPYLQREGPDMFAEQLASGAVLQSPTGVINFSDTAYLKGAPSVLPCPPGTVPTQGPGPWSASVNLETLAAGRHPESCTSSKTAPLADVSQGSTRMCSSMAFAQGYSILWALGRPAPQPVPQLSAIYAYFVQRVQECTQTGACACPTCKKPQCASACDPPCVDCGSYLAPAADVFLRGVCTSASWPMTSGLNTSPSAAARAAAGAHALGSVGCLAADAHAAARAYASLQANCPLVVFFNLAPNQLAWMSALANWTGRGLGTEGVRLPAAVAGSPVGHVALCVGYEALTDEFVVRNSFGFAWGVGGRCTFAKANMKQGSVQFAVAIVEVVS